MCYAAEIHRGVRRAFIACSWDNEHRDEVRSQTDVMDYVPFERVEPTGFAELETIELLFAVGRLNHSTSEALFEASCEAHGVDSSDELAESFGYYLAMASIGHGVCWEDDYPNLKIKVPFIEEPVWDASFDDMGDDCHALDQYPCRKEV